MNYLICYDIKHNKTRRKLSDLLEAYGVRVQFSVFTLNISASNLEKLKYRILKIISPEDELLILPLCKDCLNKALHSGKEIPLSIVV